MARRPSDPSARIRLSLILAAVLLALGQVLPALAQADATVGLGADTLFFEDAFSEKGAWGETTDERGALAYDDGTFRIALAQAGASLWSWANFRTKDPTWRMEGDVILEPGPGGGGLMCGSDADTDDFLVGAVNGANEWAIAHIHDSELLLLTGGPLPDAIDLSAGGRTRLGLECAVTGTEADHVRLWADGQLLGTWEAAPRIGPFDLAGLFASAPTTPWAARFDDLAISYGSAYLAPAVSSLGAREEFASDDFSDTSGWATPVTEAGGISYDQEALRLEVTAADGQLWSWRDLTKEAPVLRLEGALTLDGDGAGGFMCGPPSDDVDFLMGLVDASGEWVVGRLAAGQVSLLARGPLPEGLVASGGPLQVAVECAALPGEGARVAVWVEGRFAGASSAIPSLAPYLNVGVYALSGAAPLTVHVDDLRILGGPEYQPIPQA